MLAVLVTVLMAFAVTILFSVFMLVAVVMILLAVSAALSRPGFFLLLDLLLPDLRFLRFLDITTTMSALVDNYVSAAKCPTPGR